MAKANVDLMLGQLYDQQTGQRELAHIDFFIDSTLLAFNTFEFNKFLLNRKVF